MIAYFDTSAIVPLLIKETGTEIAGEFWDRADRIVSVRLAHVEARAALAHAARIGRISPDHLRSTTQDLNNLLSQLASVDIDDDLISEAGDLAEHQALRACDAVHLAAAWRINDRDVVVVAGDRALLAAAKTVGLAIAAIG